MTQTSFATQRRSSRIFSRIHVDVSGKNRDGRRFKEHAQTVVVNAHGGLLYLNQTLELGQELTVTNSETLEEMECRVVYVGETGEKGERVGLEFLTPSPRFWGLDLEPKDWTGGEEREQLN